MTVLELIKLLQKMEKDAKVFLETTTGPTPVAGVEKLGKSVVVKS